MGLKRLKRVFFYKSSVSAVLLAALLGGCSSDFSRFTEGIDKSSAPSRSSAGNAQAGIYPPAPSKNAHAKVESSDLTPPAAGGGASAASQSDFAAPKNTNQQSAEGRRNLTYKVAAGDSLIGLAKRHHISVASIKQDNGLKSDKILIGQKLILKNAVASADKENNHPAESLNPVSAPNKAAGGAEPKSAAQAPAKTDIAKSDNHAAGAGAAAAGGVSGMQNLAAPAGNAQAAKPADSGAAPAAAPPVSDKNQNAAENKVSALNSAAANAAGGAGADKNAPAKDSADSSAPMIWPVKGNIISSYGQRAGTATNDGIDIAVPEGTPVKAADSGTVIYAGDGLKEFGNTILIRHENNVVTVYGHNSKLLANRGQQVQRGQEIAQSGSSGNAGIAKLHFEVRKNSAPVNPMKYLPAAR